MEAPAMTRTGPTTALSCAAMRAGRSSQETIRPVALDLSGLRHVDDTCRAALLTWAERRGGDGAEVRLPEPLAPVPAR
jgi:ABC-type transporter Mla MlaB component